MYNVRILNGQGLILPTKKIWKIFRIRIRFLIFGKFYPIKNSWILFSEIWPASCTKKSDLIFSDFSKKIWGFKIFRFIQKKNLDLRIFVGRIKPCPVFAMVTLLVIIALWVQRDGSKSANRKPDAIVAWID